MIRACVGCLLVALGWSGLAVAADAVPRPEHPTPDAVRPHWANLNGPWQFRFDPKDEGRKAGWEKPGAAGFDRTIVVPFPWESELSGIHETDDHGRRLVSPDVPRPRRLPQGPTASGSASARSTGGPTSGSTASRSPTTRAATRRSRPTSPTRSSPAASPPSSSSASSTRPTPSLPTGKQVGWYTPTSGIWQTVWLESRPTGVTSPASRSRPAIDPARRRRSRSTSPAIAAGGRVHRLDPVRRPERRSRRLGRQARRGERRRPRARSSRVDVARPEALDARDAPPLRRRRSSSTAPDGSRPTRSRPTSASARSPGASTATSRSSASCSTASRSTSARRSTSRSTRRGSTPRPTTTSSSATWSIAKSIGLNGLRIHIKPDEPRRLYWADKLGVLILEDMPNTWRQNAEARDGVGSRRCARPSPATATTRRSSPGSPSTRPGASATARGLQDRTSDTQDWVGRMVDAIRTLDPTRLVEDNSPCNYDHVENTDLNSWHFYIDDHDEARAAHRRRRRADRAGQRVQLLPRPEAGDGPADQLGVRRRLGRRRRPRHLLGLPRPDHPAPPPAQDPGLRLHRADRHRVGAQRVRQLRPDAQGRSATTPSCPA